MSLGNTRQVCVGVGPSALSWDSRAELPGLTSLRGISAVIVVLFHIEGIVDRNGGDLVLGPFGGVVENGYLFVDMFFILSGFVIAHVYGQRALDDARSYGNFLWNRLARIYPLHLFVTIILVASGITPNSQPLFNETNTPASLMSELLLIKSLGFHDTFAWNDVSWSVSAEWFAYLLAPIFLVVVRPGRTTPRVATGVIAAAWLGMTLLSLDVPLPDVIRQSTAGAGILGFASGVALYRLHRLGFVVSIASQRATFPLSLVAIFALTSINVHYILLMPAFAAFILATIYAPSGILKRLDSKPLVHLGNISYSVYLLQLFALLVFQEYLASKPAKYWETFSPASMWFVIALFVGGLVAVSNLTYLTIERPAQATMRKMFVRKAPRP